MKVMYIIRPEEIKISVNLEYPGGDNLSNISPIVTTFFMLITSSLFAPCSFNFFYK